MARIQEEIIIITVSKLVKDTDTTETVVADDTLTALATVAEELLGSGVVVEVNKA